MKNSTALRFAALAVAGLGAAPAFAQDAGALVDKLVQKGILSDQEAAEVRAEMTRDFANTSAGKINLSNSVSEMKLYGDFRTRYQYDAKDYQADPFPVGAHQDRNEKDRSPSGTQRGRWRFRLRLNADIRLTDNFYAGVELATNVASDSGNQTFENGFNKYSIFISKAFVGWTPAEWLDVKLGKFGNPFYSTDLVWDPDINPNGLAETVSFNKIYFSGISTGYSKDGKSTAPAIHEDRPWELALVAGQFIFDDNLEGGGKDNGATDNDSTTDAYLFETQLIASYKFANGVKVTIAPAWMTYVNGSVSGAENENSFQDNGAVSGATRNLNIIQLPGDVSFKLGNVKSKVYWDFAYNIEGRKRTEDIYNLVTLRNDKGQRSDDGRTDPDDFDSKHSAQDDFAYLIGFQLGENKKKGDWSFLANWRQTGIAAVDPNLNDSDFAQGELNTRGFKVGLAYNFTDFAVLSATYMQAWNLRNNLVGGEATGGNAVAEGNDIKVLQLDLNVKF